MGFVFDWWVAEALALLIILVLVVYTNFRINYTYWKKKGIHYLEPSFPLGNSWETVLMKKSSSDLYLDMYRKRDGHKVFGIYSISSPLLVVCDPELIKMIMVKDFNNFPDRGIYVNEKTDPLSAHLFLLGGSKWRMLRNKLSPTFTSGKIRAMFDIVRDCAQTLADVLPVGDDVEVRELIARYSTDNIASCAFGIEVDSQHNPDAEFRQWGRKGFELSLRTLLTLGLGFTNPQIRRWLPLPFVPKDVTEYFTRAVADTVEYRERTGVIRRDFIQLLIQFKNTGTIDDSFSTGVQNGVEGKAKAMTIQEIAAQAWVFFIGGFETSSSAVSFCLYELSKHQDVQKRLQKEVDDVLNKNNGEITYDVMMTHLPYMEKVVSETLRKYAPVPVLNREAAHTFELPGYDCVLEKGTKILIPVIGLHHDRKYFKNPHGFDPEHFSEEQKAARHPYSYLPFGEGPRICIGMRFAHVQVRLALVYLLSRFQFQLGDATPQELRLAPQSIVPTPVDGIHLRIERRQVPSR